MKAALLYDGGEVQVEEIEAPAADGWALVSARAAGVCGTELHFVEGMIPPPTVPFVLGHESAGVVLEAPPDSGVAEGDRVAVYNMVGCGRCKPCLTGRESLCVEPIGQLGFTLPGVFSDVVRVPARNLIPLPDSVSFETAAVLSCSGMSVVHASRLAGIGLGDTVVVNGVGGVGLMAVQVAVAAGARVIAVADAGEKAELARTVGAAEAILLEGGEGYDGLPELVRDLTGGAGADHVIELVGTGDTIRAGIRSLGRSGTFVIIGYTGDHIDIHPIELILSEIRIVTSVAASRGDLETAIDLAADGRLEVTVDTRYPLEEIGTALGRLKARQVRGRNVVVW
jgi:D-arabinose 1-dehydrogenase-like Zn-dependent alcohol dehydrogenase